MRMCKVCIMNSNISHTSLSIWASVVGNNTHWRFRKQRQLTTSTHYTLHTESNTVLTRSYTPKTPIIGKPISPDTSHTSLITRKRVLRVLNCWYLQIWVSSDQEDRSAQEDGCRCRLLEAGLLSWLFVDEHLDFCRKCPSAAFNSQNCTQATKRLVTINLKFSFNNIQEMQSCCWKPVVTTN